MTQTQHSNADEARRQKQYSLGMAPFLASSFGKPSHGKITVLQKNRWIT
jgi:hypothetical protein